MGFTHSDLHPGNVVFDKKYITFLIDVALSRAAESTQSEDIVYGRLEYLPPESFKKGRYTQKSDIYCLGHSYGSWSSVFHHEASPRPLPVTQMICAKN